MTVLSKRTRTDDALAGIDAALAADIVLCFCGCGRLVDHDAPSLYYKTQTCSIVWHMSQEAEDPAAWRVDWHALSAEQRDFALATRGLPNVDDSPLPARPSDGPSPMDTLDARPPYRRPYGPTPAEQDAAAGRPEGWTQRAMAAPRPRRPGRVRTPERTPEQAREVAINMQFALRDGSMLAAMEQQQRAVDAQLARMRQNEWSIEYVPGGLFEGNDTTWLVRAGTLSEYVVVPYGQNHNEIVMECVNRLRAAQNGRIE